MLSEISGELSAFFGAAAYVLLLFTPGAWIASGLRLPGVPYWARLSTGAALSPLIVCIEFYILRLIGASFAITAVLLVALNLPALYLLWIRRVKSASFRLGNWLTGAAAIVIPAICLLGVLAYPGMRLFSPHGWYHEDVSYMLARGNLVMESPTLAGIRLSYPPWGPLVLPTVQSFLVQSPPVSNYVWSDLLWMIIFFAFAAGIAKEMGGGRLARISSGVWLLIGSNPIGYLLMKWNPGGVLKGCCDTRYIQSFIKFEIYGPMALGLAMLMAIIYFLIRSEPLTTGITTVIFVLLSGIGLLYPLLFPPACCVMGARALALFLDEKKGNWPTVRGEWFLWAGLIAVAGVLTYLEIRFLMLYRHATESTLSLSGPIFAATKLLEALGITSLLLCGWLFTVQRCWKSRRMATAILSIAAAANYLLYAIFHIPFYNNEYKFVFAAAMCLSVFPGIAVERIWREWPRKMSTSALAVLGCLVLGTYGQFEWLNWPVPWVTRQPGERPFERIPAVDATGFYMKLDRSESWWSICDAVSRMTPGDSVLLIDNGDLYYPGLTARSLYVSAPDRLYAGLQVATDDLDADLRGYGREILADRRATQADLFRADDCCRARALDKILALKRSVAIIAEPRHAELTEWLKRSKRAKQLFVSEHSTLWLIDAVNAGAK